MNCVVYSFRKIGKRSGRGVVLKCGQTLRGLYEERVPLYEQYADLVVDEESRNVKETIRQIVTAYGKRNQKR